MDRAVWPPPVCPNFGEKLERLGFLGRRQFAYRRLSACAGSDEKNRKEKPHRELPSCKPLTNRSSCRRGFAIKYIDRATAAIGVEPHVAVPLTVNVAFPR